MPEEHESPDRNRRSPQMLSVAQSVERKFVELEAAGS